MVCLLRINFRVSLCVDLFVMKTTVLIPPHRTTIENSPSLCRGRKGYVHSIFNMVCNSSFGSEIVLAQRMVHQSEIMFHVVVALSSVFKHFIGNETWINPVVAYLCHLRHPKNIELFEAPDLTFSAAGFSK